MTCDAHKWFSVPMGCGMFFCRHRETVAEAFRADVTYMPSRVTGTGDPEAASATFNPLTTSAQWSRRFIGLKLFMALAHQGEAGYAAMIEHQTRMGEHLRECLAASGWRIVNSTPLPLVCFTRPGLHPARLLAALRDGQIAWMSEAQVDGTEVMRACITSFRTTAQDIDSVVGEMNRLVARMELATRMEPNHRHDSAGEHSIAEPSFTAEPVLTAEPGFTAEPVLTAEQGIAATEGQILR